jgi:signal transduction histidine kinase
VTRRLVLSYVALVLFVLGSLAYPLGVTFASRERDRLLRDIEHDASVVATLAEDSLERGVTPPIDKTLAEYAREPGGRIVVVDTNGLSVADSAHPTELGASFLNRPEIVTALAGKRAEGERRSNTLNGDLLYVAIPVASSGVVHGAVRVTYGSSALDKRVRDVWIALGGMGLLVVGVAAGVGFALAQLVTRPVARLKAAATQIAAGNLDARAPTDSGAPELRELAAVFNHSAAQVQSTLAAQQAFVADASHQLRTPLAALRLRLENIEARAPAELQPELAATRAETARLTRISDTLLALTRAPVTTAAVGPVDVTAVIAERITHWGPTADELDVDLRYDGPTTPVWVGATRDALDQILDNLIDNALEVAPASSSIDIEVQRDDDRVSLHVLDRGPGLTPEQRGHAFDRFWRGPGAEPGGTGLGLAIVAALSEACGGRAELRARVEGGLDAVVTLRPSRPISPT